MPGCLNRAAALDQMIESSWPDSVDEVKTQIVARLIHHEQLQVLWLASVPVRDFCAASQSVNSFTSSSAKAAPHASITTSPRLGCRPGTNDWCHSSLHAYTTVNTQAMPQS